MKEQLEEIRARALSELSDSATVDQIENVRVRVLGRSGELTENVLISLQRIVLGFLLGGVPAIVIGIAMGIWRPIRAMPMRCPIAAISTIAWTGRRRR